jgi:hypothetical protein
MSTPERRALEQQQPDQQDQCHRCERSLLGEDTVAEVTMFLFPAAKMLDPSAGDAVELGTRRVHASPCATRLELRAERDGTYDAAHSVWRVPTTTADRPDPQAAIRRFARHEANARIAELVTAGRVIALGDGRFRWAEADRDGVDGRLEPDGAGPRQAA